MGIEIQPLNDALLGRVDHVHRDVLHAARRCAVAVKLDLGVRREVLAGREGFGEPGADLRGLAAFAFVLGVVDAESHGISPWLGLVGRSGMHEDVDRTPLIFRCKIEAELAVAELHVHGVAREQDRPGIAHEDQDRNLVDRAL